MAAARLTSRWGSRCAYAASPGSASTYGTISTPPRALRFACRAGSGSSRRHNSSASAMVAPDASQILTEHTSGKSAGNALMTGSRLKTGVLDEATLLAHSPRLRTQGRKFVLLSGIKQDSSTRRFYKNVTVGIADPKLDGVSGYTILLDDRTILTPSRQVALCLPSERLAAAVAHEWESQDVQIRLYAMELTRLAVVTQDQLVDEPARAQFETRMAGSLQFDHVFFWPTTEAVYRARAQKYWGPLLDWAGRRFDTPVRPINIEPSNDGGETPPLLVEDDIESISEVVQEDGTTISVHSRNYEGPPELKKRVAELLKTLDPWTLVALDHIADAGQSMIIALALLHNEITLDEAFNAAQLEEKYDMERFGESQRQAIESAKVEMSIAAGCTFFRMLRDPTPAEVEEAKKAAEADSEDRVVEEETTVSP